LFTTVPFLGDGVLIDQRLDLKPANILIDAATDTLILSDFGVAQVMASHEKVKHRVGMTVDAASFAYASPEVMRFFIEPPRNPTQADMDEWTRNPARDVFAFAIICWEMLSREAPWGAMDSSQIYQQVGKNNFRPTLPIDQTRRKLVSARQATSWARYETAIGKGAIENLCKLLNSAWKTEHQQRASASELLAQIKSIKLK
jgi:serine/threonine protein kinase